MCGRIRGQIRFAVAPANEGSQPDPKIGRRETKTLNSSPSSLCSLTHPGLLLLCILLCISHILPLGPDRDLALRRRRSLHPHSLTPTAPAGTTQRTLRGGAQGRQSTTSRQAGQARLRTTRLPGFLLGASLQVPVGTTSDILPRDITNQPPYDRILQNRLSTVYRIIALPCPWLAITDTCAMSLCWPCWPLQRL